VTSHPKARNDKAKIRYRKYKVQLSVLQISGDVLAITRCPITKKPSRHDGRGKPFPAGHACGVVATRFLLIFKQPHSNPR
jgi:hypothetical protein